MWKKLVPTVAVCSFLLVGCNNTNDAVPSNNETPMEDVQKDINTPSASPHIDNGMYDTENGTMYDEYNNGGIMDNGTMDNGTMDNNGDINNGTMDGNSTTKDGKWIKTPSTQQDDNEMIHDKAEDK